VSERESRVSTGPPDTGSRVNGSVPAARGTRQQRPDQDPDQPAEPSLFEPQIRQPQVPDPQPPEQPRVTAAPGRALVRPSAQLAAMQERQQSASELREALEDLRRVLDVGPLAARPRRRWRLRAVLLLLTLAVVAGLVLVGTRVLRPGDDETRQGVSTATLSAPGEGSPTAASLPTTGPGVDTPGTFAAVAVSDDDSGMDVFEQVLLPAPGVAALRLATPSVAGLRGNVAELDPKVEDLQVALDGEVAQLQRGSAAGTWTATPLQGGTVTKAQLRYRLADVIARNSPSRPGRALGLVGPLSGQQVREAGLPIAMRFPDQAVLAQITLAPPG
jgi:hypothetical protein